MTNKPKSRRCKNATKARNAAPAADSSSGLNSHTSPSAKAGITAEGRKSLRNSDSTSPTIGDMHSIEHGSVKQSVADTGAHPMPSEPGLHFTPASSLGPGYATNLPTEHVPNLEAPEVKTALTTKQLKKRARKLKQAQKAKVAPAAISSDELDVSGTLTEAINPSHQSPIPVLSDTVAPTFSECHTSEDKDTLMTGNERPSKPSAKNSSADHGGQLLNKQMEYGQRVEPVDMEFDALMAELRQQGLAAEAKYADLMSGVRQRADARDVPVNADAPIPKGYNDAAGPILQRRFSFIQGKPDIADIRPISMESSESLELGRSKGKIRCVSSSGNTLVDGDTLLETCNSRNLGADFAEPFVGAEMSEQPKESTSPSLGEEVSPPIADVHARSSRCRQSYKLSHNMAGNARRMRKQGISSRPVGNGKAFVADFDHRDWVETDAIEDEGDYSGDNYGEESEDEGISDELAAVLELKGKRLEALVRKRREEMGELQDRYLTQRGYFKRRGAGRR